MDNEDVVVLELARRLRRKSRPIYDKFIRVAVRYLQAATIGHPEATRHRVADLTEVSSDGVSN